VPRCLSCGCFRGCSPSVSLVQHAAIVLIGVCRVFTSLYYGEVFTSVPLPVAGLLTAVPYSLVFWVYTMITTQWAALHHFAMRNAGHGFKAIQPYFVALNVIMTSCVITMFVSVTTASSNEVRVIIAQIGSTVMAAISGLSGLSFIIYGFLIARTLRVSSDMLQDTGRDATLSLARRMFFVSSVVSSCLVAESVFWILSVFAQSSYVQQDTTLTTAFLACDVATLLSMLVLFKKHVADLARDANAKEVEITSKAESLGDHSDHEEQPKRRPHTRNSSRNSSHSSLPSAHHTVAEPPSAINVELTQLPVSHPAEHQQTSSLVPPPYPGGLGDAAAIANETSAGAVTPAVLVSGLPSESMVAIDKAEL